MLERVDKKRIIVSLVTIGAAAALLVGATLALLTDTETSEDNTFSVGGLDLKVDSEAHYAGLVCTGTHPNTTWQLEATPSSRPDLIGEECDGTWEETDLGLEHQFFNLEDLKPGDSGEVTISLHVIDNDAWGRFIVSNVEDLENTCIEAEEDANDTSCTTTNGDGELRENLLFRIWLDDGQTPGFQGTDDPGEGDNILNEGEQILVTQGTVDQAGETHNIWQGLAAVAAEDACTGDGQTGGANPCQGLAQDGRMVESTTYYFGIDWVLPEGTGNQVQTDSLSADMVFEVEQHRNNPVPFDGP